MNIRIKAVGDVMPSGVLYDSTENFVSPEVLNCLADADIRLGNLESAIGPYTDSPTFDKGKMERKMDIIWAIDEDLDRLTQLGLDVVSLANNHIYDLGEDGLTHTISELDKRGIKHCGAGRNLKEASQPAVFKVKDKTIAFLSFCDYREETVGYVPFAKEDAAGLNPLYPLSYSCSEIHKYKTIYDYVFVVPHWGVENTWWTTPQVIKDARALIDAGADGILGGHPHRVQANFKYRHKPVFPSLGNFFFPDRFLNKPRPTWYPPKGTDTSCYPRVFGYPWVKEPVMKIWCKESRLGMIADIKIQNDTISSTCDYAIVR